MYLLLAALVSCLLPGLTHAADGAAGEAPMQAQAPEEALAGARAGLERARAARQAGDAETARSEVGAALERLADLPLGEGHDATAYLLWELGTVAFESGDVAGAQAAWSRAVDHFERTLGEDDRMLLMARANLAIATKWLGDFEGARRLEQAVAAGMERTLGPDDPSVLSALHNLAVTLRDLGELDEARAMFERVLTARERILPEGDPKLLRTRSNLAATLMFQGEFTAARALQEGVLAECECTLPEDHRDLVSARFKLGITLYELGDFAGARALFEAVIESDERTLPEDHPDLLSARGNLAQAMSVMGDVAGARALEERVLAGYERTFPADHPARLLAQANLGSLAHAAGDLGGARRLLESALAGFERIYPPGHLHRVRTMRMLTETLRRAGELDEALALAKAVLEKRERNLDEDHPLVLVARQNLAATLAEMGEREAARPIQEAVLEVYDRTLPAAHPDRLGLLTDLGITAREEGDVGRAHELGAEAARALLVRLGSALDLSPREARELTGSAAYAHSVVRYLTRPAAGEAPEPIRFELAETLRATAVDTSRLPTDDRRRFELAEVRARLNDLVGAGPSEGLSREQLAAEVSQLSLERDRLERAIRSERDADGPAPVPVRAADVARALPERAAAVGYLRDRKWVFDPETSDSVLSGDVLEAHVVRTDGTVTELELGPIEELEALALAWRGGIGRPLAARGVAMDGPRVAATADEARAAGRRLRRRVLDPVLAAAGEIDTLHVTADDFLHVVPLDALPLDAQSPRSAASSAVAGVAGDRLRFVSEVSFRRLLREPAPLVAGGGLLALGGVRFDAASEETLDGGRAAEAGADRDELLGWFAPLPETRREAERVRAVFDRTAGGEATSVLLDGAEADRAAFRERAPGKRYLHVATHGWFAPESIASTTDTHGLLGSGQDLRKTVAGLAPMTLCGLAFAGANAGRDSLGRVPGILTAEELAGIDLSACELAVLSACETNVGIRRAGQGVQSLQAALHAAGVRTAITSLWKVDDTATRKLFERFYACLWVEGMSKADALWKAKCDLRAEGHPERDWAAWVLSGDPR